MHSSDAWRVSKQQKACPHCKHASPRKRSGSRKLEAKQQASWLGHRLGFHKSLAPTWSVAEAALVGQLATSGQALVRQLATHADLGQASMQTHFAPALSFESNIEQRFLADGCHQHKRGTEIWQACDPPKLDTGQNVVFLTRSGRNFLGILTSNHLPKHRKAALETYF